MHLHPCELITNMLIIVFVLVFYISVSGVQNSDKMLHKDIFHSFPVFVIFYATMDIPILSVLFFFLIFKLVFHLLT